MYMKTLIVQGMHCGACKKLIMMELEEVGLDALVKNVEIMEEEKKGVFHLDENISDEELEKVKSIINGMEGYTVV